MSNNIPVVHIPVGHSRFRFKSNEDGTFDLIVFASDKKLSVGTHTQEELWCDQLVEAQYVIRFDNAEHIKGYAMVLYDLIDVIMKRHRKENENV